MLVFPSSEVAPEPAIRAVSAKTLRQWCTPGVILVITELSDELLLLPHAIKQARQSGAKIVLVHLVAPQQTALDGRRSAPPRAPSGIQEARAILERMARQLRWLGIACEPAVLTGYPEVEIPLIARSCSADRAIIGFGTGSDLAKRRIRTVAEQLLANIDVPTCVIGRRVGLGSQSSRLTKNITLAVSLDSDCDIPLSFASRLAQEQRAKLTILHVLDRRESGLDESGRAPMAVVSRLPALTWREAELLCPAEIKVREGNAAEEILKHAVSTGQDLILLCSTGISPTGQPWRTSVSHRVLSEAECPVFVLQKELGSARLAKPHSPNPEKVAAYGEDIPNAARKEII